MNQAFRFVVLSGLAALLLAPAAMSQTPPAGAPAGTPPKQRGQRVDMDTLPRPIDAKDTVWIEDMTRLEVRDAIKAGKTTAMIFAGGMEDNGPYIVVSQHGNTVKGFCDIIARKLGNALCAPIAFMAPANLERASAPGSVSITAETFKAVLSDEATSLKAQGFKNILFLCDHGSDEKPMQEAVAALAEKWKDSGTGAYYVKEYYDDKALVTFEQEVLGVHEETWTGPRYHDDYPYAVVSMVFAKDDVRLDQRIKAKQTMVNGIDINTPKAMEDGRKLIAFHSDLAIKAIQKLIPPTP